jgi:hypothetical protein
LLRSVETDGKSVFRILVHLTGKDRPGRRDDGRLARLDEEKIGPLLKSGVAPRPLNPAMKYGEASAGVDRANTPAALR